MKRASFRAVPTILLVLGLASCDSGIPPESVVAGIVIDPASVDLEAEATARLDATPVDVHGNVLAGRQIFWTSENASVAMISETGVVTGVEPGSTRVAASAEGVGAIATVLVLPRSVARVEISPELDTLVVGATRTYTARPYASDGDLLEDRVIEWTSSDAKVGTVSDAGVVRARGVGSAFITANIEGERAVALLTVVPVPVSSVSVDPAQAEVVVGGTVRLHATARDADGDDLDGRSIAWSTDRSAIALVSDEGVVTGVAPGEAVITASSEGREGSAKVTVLRVPVASVVVSPATLELIVGESYRLSASPRAADGSELDDREVSWTTSDDDFVTVDGDGLVQAVGVGSATITATSEGVDGDAVVTVVPVPVDRVVLDPTSVELFIDQTFAFSVRLEDADGDSLDDREVTWTSSAEAVVTVDDEGRIRGVGKGSATVTAESEGKEASATVVVRLPPAVLLMVSGNGQSGARNSTLPNPLVVEVVDAEGDPVPGVQVVWTPEDTSDSVDPEIFTTDEQGHAATEWTLGDGSAVLRRVRARVDGVIPIDFYAFVRTLSAD